MSYHPKLQNGVSLFLQPDTQKLPACIDRSVGEFSVGGIVRECRELGAGWA
jgi:hypothetical protein